MASKPVAQLSAAEKEQLAVSYAAFVLSGQGAAVTVDSINAVLTAAGLTASAGLVKAFAKTLATRKVTEFVGSVSSGSAPVDAPAGKKDAPKDNKPADNKPAGKNVPPPPPPPAEEEEGVDMGGLFD